jgi:hypothetical protein
VRARRKRGSVALPQSLTGHKPLGRVVLEANLKPAVRNRTFSSNYLAIDFCFYFAYDSCRERDMKFLSSLVSVVEVKAVCC